MSRGAVEADLLLRGACGETGHARARGAEVALRGDRVVGWVICRAGGHRSRRRYVVSGMIDAHMFTSRMAMLPPHW